MRVRKSKSQKKPYKIKKHKNARPKAHKKTHKTKKHKNARPKAHKKTHKTKKHKNARPKAHKIKHKKLKHTTKKHSKQKHSKKTKKTHVRPISKTRKKTHVKKNIKKTKFSKKKRVKKTVPKKKTFSKSKKKTVKIKKPSKIEHKIIVPQEKTAPTISVATMKRHRKVILNNESVRKYLIENAGEHAIVIIQNLITPTTDEDLAKKLKVRVSEIRSALNKLHGMRLTQYSRTKDADTGWYTYKWNIRHDKVVDICKVIDAEIEKKLNSLPKILYICDNCEDEIWTFDEAMDMKFKCPKCGSLMVEPDDKFKEKLKTYYLQQ